jgi:hypothetical protein
MPLKHPVSALTFNVYLVLTLIVAFLSWAAPGGRMPLNFHTLLWGSLPLACLWVIAFRVSIEIFGRKGVWVLLGAPLALYWPIYLFYYGFPACYWVSSCAQQAGTVRAVDCARGTATGPKNLPRVPRIWKIKLRVRLGKLSPPTGAGCPDKIMAPVVAITGMVAKTVYAHNPLNPLERECQKR